MISISVFGVNETIARFAKDVAKVEAIKLESEASAAEAVLRSAQDRVPVLTGALKATIRIEERDGETLVVAGGEGVDYAPFVEFAPDNEPFLRPAADDSRNEVVQTMARVISGVL